MVTTISPAEFRKSSYSGCGGCVYVNPTADGYVLVCDGKNWDKLPLHLPAHLWELFIGNVNGNLYGFDRLGTEVLELSCCDGHHKLHLSRSGGIVTMAFGGRSHGYNQREWDAFERGTHDGEFDVEDDNGHLRLLDTNPANALATASA